MLDPFNNGLACDAAEMRALLQRVLGPQADLSPEHFDAVPIANCVLLRLENNVRLRLARGEDWAGASRSLDRMLAVAPDRAELLFESGQINARLDKRRAAIAAFERFLATERPRPIASFASVPLSCCRNCDAGLTDITSLPRLRGRCQRLTLTEGVMNSLSRGYFMTPLRRGLPRHLPRRRGRGKKSET